MRKIIILTLATLTLCACGELSYKRGASVSELENTRKACQSKGSISDVQQCMEENGWSVQQLDSFEILTDFNKIPVKLTESSDAVANDASASSNQMNPEVGSQPKKMVESNPLDTFVVPSWWKTGVKPESFKIDSDACVAKLGEAHQPEHKTQTVTFAFIGCMSEKGWKAFRKN